MDTILNHLCLWELQKTKSLFDYFPLIFFTNCYIAYFKYMDSWLLSYFSFCRHRCCNCKEWQKDMWYWRLLGQCSLTSEQKLL